MKIAYKHLVQHIEESPNIEHISNKLFQLGHEHEIDNDIFDIEFTPNRGDCLSINGLLRDLAVFYTINLNQEVFSEKLNELQLDFENLSEKICPKISFLKLEIDQVPKEYKNSLDNYFTDLKLNKNNFFTDVSNYLSYETGQPTHCYDANKIDGKIVFDEIEGDEDFETLLGTKINLTGKNAVFLLNDKVINLAGIIGGNSSACSSDTKTVIVECAFFKSDAITGKSVKYDINSDASHKFERGVDPNYQEKALRRFIKIVGDHANIKKVEFISCQYKDIPTYKIPVDVSKINQIIGFKISEEEYIRILSKLSFTIEKGYVQIPSFRSDIRTQNDLSEEIARSIGYDNIEKSEVKIPKSKIQNLNQIENKLRHFLLDNGFYEVINSPFTNHVDDSSIKVDNPLDSNREFLRTNLINSLLENLLFNEKRQKDSIKLFEISEIYSSKNDICKERKLGIIASGRVGLNYEDFSKKINKSYLSKLLNQLLPNNNFDVNTIPRKHLDTKISNEIISLEVDTSVFNDNILKYSQKSTPPNFFNQYMPISELPSSAKDISYAIKDYSKVKELEDLLLNYQNNIIKHAYIFDYFFNKKNNEIKVGFRFVFQSNELTLTSDQIDVVYNNIIKESLKINGVSIPGLDH
jgi:phenylalanyl-tRNA synthetase beta chain